MKIREVNQKAENLIEQGENAKQRQIHYQQAANSARSQLMAAYARLEAASETDEDGEPVGDVAGAQAEIYAAQAFLASAESGLMEATHQLDGINQQKLDTVQEIERYESVEEHNLSILAQLQQKQFGTNAAAFMADLAARMNSGEQARLQLLTSMGMAATAKTFSSGGAGGSGSHMSSSNQSSQEDQSAAGFGSSFTDRLFGKFKSKKDIKFWSSTGTPIFKKYQSAEDMPEEVWNAANDYQTNHMDKYNAIMRQGKTSNDIENLKSIIGDHRVVEDTVFYRRASLADLGESFQNCSLDELVGKRYQFQGIMSATGSKGMANSVSSGDVIFEISAPAGTPALDLTDVASFQEVMFNSPLCYIEKVEQEGYNTTKISIKVFSSNEYHNIVDGLKGNDVVHNPIQRFGRDRSSEEIAARISGGDETEGSCSSLAFAFAGNEAGYDVLDFRDGSSRDFFSSRDSVKKVASLPGVISSTEYGFDDVTCVNKLLQKVTPGKNYYLATGGHAAIIRNNGNQFEYLELQHPGNWNGWHSLNEGTLINRFGCSRNRFYENSSFLMDVQSLSNSQEFLDILGYINTHNQDQRKGSSGNVK